MARQPAGPGAAPAAKRVPRKTEVLVLNQIAPVGLKRFPIERYSLVKDAKAPEKAPAKDDKKKK